LYRVFKKFVTKILRIHIIYHTKEEQKIKLKYSFIRRYLLCAAVMMKFFGSLFFSYFFSVVDAAIEDVVVTNNNSYL
jgi:hypothetical protein